MDAHRFDALARALHTAGTRRALSGLLATLLGLAAMTGLVPGATAKRKDRQRRKQKKARTEGPCGNGKDKANRCKRNRQCCTGYCQTRKKKRKNGKKRTVQGRCRCRKAGQSCNDDRNCCPDRTGRTCVNGACGVCGDVCENGCPFSDLQEAIDAAAGGDIIRLCAETYMGPITIDKNLTLQGVGTDDNGTILDGEENGSAVTVTGEVTVELQQLRITGGNTGAESDGGGVLNLGDATLTLTNCTVTGNEADFGGGIASFGTLTLDESDVTTNTARSEGGGILNFGTLTLNDSTVTENEAVENAGGILNYSTLVLNGTSVIEDNDPDECVNAIGGTGCP